MTGDATSALVRATRQRKPTLQAVTGHTLVPHSGIMRSPTASASKGTRFLYETPWNRKETTPFRRPAT